MVRRDWLAELPPQPDAAAQEESALAERAAAEAPVETPPWPPDSRRARALDAIARIGMPLRLAASVVHADPSQLSIRLTDGEGTALTLFIERACDGGRYYQRGGRLGLWYGREQGTERGSPAWATAVLEEVAKALLSPAFDGIADELTERQSSLSVAHGVSAAAPGADVHAAVAAGTVAATDPARPYARLSVLGANDVERFFHVDYQYDAGADVDQPPTTRIGIIYQCNQPCTFCQLAEMNTHIPPARIYAALDASRTRGARRVILTGGEPTLCRHLPDYVAYAREHGYTTIELQTNATLLDDAARALRLRQAGLTDAQVSLHGPDSEISDRLTAAPGTHRRTLDGIGNLLDVGVRVLLNHLIFRDNCHLLVDFIDMVEQRWGRHRERVIIQFHSPLSEFARPELARKHIARYTEYAAQLRRAIDRGRALGYALKDLQDPTGIPALCVLGADSDYLGPILSQRVKPRFHRWESGWLTRVAACKTCEIADACMGVPKGYVEIHGDGEFRSIRLADLSPNASALTSPEPAP